MMIKLSFPYTFFIEFATIIIRGIMMTKIMNRVIDDIQILSQDEKSSLMKLLIASMDETHDKNSDEQWASLAEKRYEEINLGQVKTVNWNQIKQQVLS